MCCLFQQAAKDIGGRAVRQDQFIVSEITLRVPSLRIKPTARQPAVFRVSIENTREYDLTRVVEAHGLSGLLLGGTERRQQHGRQDRNDGDYDQQLDQRKEAVINYGSKSRLAVRLNNIVPVAMKRVAF